MWPFKRKKSSADIAIEWMPRAIEVACEKWIVFDQLPFNSSISLLEKIGIFLPPFQSGLRSWKAFRDAPDAIFLLIAAKGIEKSGTYSTYELEEALGLPIPKT